MLFTGHSAYSIVLAQQQLQNSKQWLRLKQNVAVGLCTFDVNAMSFLQDKNKEKHLW